MELDTKNTPLQPTLTPDKGRISPSSRLLLGRAQPIEPATAYDGKATAINSLETPSGSPGLKTID